jgi:hypothetical protein
MVSQSGLKTGGGGAWMVHMASLQSSCGDEAKDGWVDVTASDSSNSTLQFSCIVLGPKGILGL